MAKDSDSKTVRERYRAWAKKRGAPERALPADKSAALVETMVMAACIDGVLVDGEATALRSLILSTPGFEGLDGEGLSSMVDSVARRIAAEGIEARVDAIAAALGEDPSLREDAFLLATAFVHFDGEVGDEEQSLLELLQRALDISDERASDIDARVAELRASDAG
jgi:tellurite resistance protein